MKNGISTNGYVEWIYSSPFHVEEKEEPRIFVSWDFFRKQTLYLLNNNLRVFFFNSYLFAFLKFLLKDSWFTMLCFRCTARWFSLYTYIIFLHSLPL